jgi:hypothetical protein
VPREVAFAPGVELHKGLRDRVREVLLHPQGVPIRSTSRSSKLARKGICEKL